MIVEMKHLTLLCVAREGVKALESLRDIGCVHLDLSAADSPDFASAKEELAAAERAVRIVAKAAREAGKDASAPKGEESARLENAKSAALVEEILKVDAARQAADDEADALRQTMRAYAPFGDFDPELAKSLRAAGVPVRLAVNGERPPQGKAFFGEELPEGWTEVALPAERLSATQARLAAAEAHAAACRAALAEANARVSTIEARYPALKDQVAFAAARDVLATQGEISWITGWVPVDSVPRLRAKAVSRGWGILLREARPDETPPTLIRPPKLFRPVTALFSGLGIAPAYNESDVSVPFLCYFSLFFAMLVGDGGYGAIILALTAWGWVKTRPGPDKRHRPALVRSWLTLLTVFSTATIIWGLLSNTWFGAGLPFARDWATVKWLADPSYGNMMLLCFTIGASHLMIARVWSGISMINDRVCLSQSRVPEPVRLGGDRVLHVLDHMLHRGHLQHVPAVALLGAGRVARSCVRVHAEGERVEEPRHRARHAAAQRDELPGRHHLLCAPVRGGPGVREGGAELQRHGRGPGPADLDQVDSARADPARGPRAQLRDGGSLDPRARRAPQHA